MTYCEAPNPRVGCLKDTLIHRRTLSLSRPFGPSFYSKKTHFTDLFTPPLGSVGMLELCCLLECWNVVRQCYLDTQRRTLDALLWPLEETDVLKD